MKKKEFATIIIGIIVIVAVIIIARLYPPKPKQSALKIQNIPVNSLPVNFPVGVPMEAGASIVDNYNSTSADGRVQATRTIESKKSLEENFVLYKVFIMSRQSGWTFLSEVNDSKQSNNKALFARSGYGYLSINISARDAKTSLVEISFLANKK